MSREVRLLVVEDNDLDRGIWARVIERHNATCGADVSQFSLVTANDLSSANNVLAASYVDAAVVDLRLDGNGRDPENSSGNEVLSSILAKKLAVVAVFTGQPADAKVPDFAAGQVRVFTKGGDDNDGTAAVMTWLVQQSPIIRCMQDASDVIRSEMASVFNNSIWPRWRLWMAEPDAQKKGFLSSSVARHMISHVHEILTDSLQGGAHAEEWYLVPPSTGEFRTGDILRNENGGFEIVVTPRCDIATSKFKSIQLASCDDITMKWTGATDRTKNAHQAEVDLQKSGATPAELADAKDALQKAKNKLNELARHDGNKSAVHFLPRMKLSNGATMGPLLVRFDNLRSVDKNSKEAEKLRETKIATVAPAFLPAMVERLGAFFSRIGSPDYYHFDD